MTPGAGSFLAPGHNFTNLLEVHKVMLHTKYQSSRPYGFRQEDFFMFLPIKAYVKPRAGMINRNIGQSVDIQKKNDYRYENSKIGYF